MQLLAQVLASLFIDGQTNFEVNNLVVVLIPGCARLWIMLNTQFSGMLLQYKVSSSLDSSRRICRSWSQILELFLILEKSYGKKESLLTPSISCAFAIPS
ncbi:hypothetical protein TNIN_80701 [Trichonephila inaurata madagascariensis]|uniref:Uncharacterized protein n=1 Tax=Trichonephila inaurata madagascariensis TaxID=2747483 RepID=A0A8X6IDI8_9ARAC|nr:hypothetical protein TNIN_80701 [Trichonephila inaurata madagascariensis]